MTLKAIPEIIMEAEGVQMDGNSSFAIVLLVLTSICFSEDTLFHTDFTEGMPEGWIPGEGWGYSDSLDAMNQSISSHASGYSGLDEDWGTLWSHTLVLPEDADSLLFVFDVYWHGWGQGFGIPDVLESESKISVRSPDTLGTELVLQSFYASGYTSYDQTYEDIYAIPVTSLQPGDSLVIGFWGYTAAEPDDFYMEFYTANLDWSIREAAVLAYELSSLSPSTWGGIKSGETD